MEEVKRRALTLEPRNSGIRFQSVFQNVPKRSGFNHCKKGTIGEKKIYFNNDIAQIFDSQIQSIFNKQRGKAHQK